MKTLKQGRQYIDTILSHIGQTLVDAGHISSVSLLARHTHRAFDVYCQKLLVETFNQHCFDLAKNAYALTKMYKFANVCARANVDLADVAQHIMATCDSESHTKLTGVQ